MGKRAATREAEQTPPEKRTRRRSQRLKDKNKDKEEKKELALSTTKSKSQGKEKAKTSSRQTVRAQSTDVGEPQSTSESESNVIYLGHIPHGFYEHQIRGYFSQFGEISKVRLSRSKTTGKSKGYAFVEFDSAEVAKIAAEAMHDYLMFGQKLVCKLVPLEELHPHTFKGANKRFKAIPWRKIESERHNKERSKGEETKRKKRLAAKDVKRNKRILDAGIQYQYGQPKAATKKNAARKRRK